MHCVMCGKDRLLVSEVCAFCRKEMHRNKVIQGRGWIFVLAGLPFFVVGLYFFRYQDAKAKASAAVDAFTVGLELGQLDAARRQFNEKLVAGADPTIPANQRKGYIAGFSSGVAGRTARISDRKEPSGDYRFPKPGETVTIIGFDGETREYKIKFQNGDEWKIETAGLVFPESSVEQQ